MECLKGYIGVSSDVPVDSGLYIDALPDISVSLLNGLVIEDANYSALWEKIEQRTILKFRTFFIREVNKCHKISDIGLCECLICENKSLLATSLWYLLGAEVMYERYSSSRLNSYTTIDHAKAKELNAYYMEQFNDELEIAVNGLDIHSSSCFEDGTGEQIPENGIITFKEPII